MVIRSVIRSVISSVNFIPLSLEIYIMYMIDELYSIHYNCTSPVIT